MALAGNTAQEARSISEFRTVDGIVSWVEKPPASCPRSFGVQPTADSADEKSALACNRCREQIAVLPRAFVLYRRDPFLPASTRKMTP
jgi:hypothetical protein